MPYITEERRVGLAEHADRIATSGLYSRTDLIYIVRTLTACAGGLDTFQILSSRFKPISSAMEVIILELLKRKAKGELIGGDLNFTICRILVGATGISEVPQYESKIQFIEEIIEYVKLKLFVTYDNPISDNDDLARALGVLGCVGKELYRRYACAYEDIKQGENGDILD